MNQRRLAGSLARATAISGSAALVVLVSASRSAAQHYQPIDLGVVTGFGESAAFDVNNHGQVAGTLTTGGSDPIAFIWLPAPAYGLPAGMTALGTLPSGGSGWSFGEAINDCGEIVGSSTTTQAIRAYVWQNGSMRDLGALGGLATASSGALDINDRGYVVGHSDAPLAPSFETHPFLTCAPCLSPTLCTMRDLGTLGGPWAAANAINESNQIVGESRLDAPPGEFITHAFFRENNTSGLVDLGTLPGGVTSVATAVNEKPVVAGWCGVDGPGGYTERVVLWKRVGGIWTITDLGTFLDNTYNYPTAIDENGVVIGRAYGGALGQRPFRWINGVFQDINDLIVDTGTTPIFIEEALGMNDRGDIAAFGINGTGQARAFLLRRIP